MEPVDLAEVRRVHDAWLSEKVEQGNEDPGFDGPDGGEFYADDEELWVQLEAIGVAEAQIEEARTSFRPDLHPRNRVGQFTETPDRLRKIIPNLHIVGGAVRDKLFGREPKDFDFLAPGEDAESLSLRLRKHGRVDELVVDGRKVGVRFHPNDFPSPPEGIEITPPRREVSTGPGRHDFEIVADADTPVADDMARRDFTINAIAETPDGELIDPFNGAKDVETKTLRVVGETAFRDDGLRIIRGLRLISQFDLEPEKGTADQMRQWAHRIQNVSGERVRTEFHKLLMGEKPAKALRVARDTGVLRHMFPEWAQVIGFEQQSRYHGLTADEHIFEVVQASADAGDPLPVRIAAFWHDAGKPDAAWLGPDGLLHYYENPSLGKRSHEDISADLFRRASGPDRLAYPTVLREQVAAIIAGHMFQDHAVPKRLTARKFRAKYGDMLAPLLIAHKRADIRGKESDEDEAMQRQIEKLARFEQLIEQESNAPVFVSDLEVGGDDLIRLGYTPGLEIGGALEALRAQVIGNPKNNNREWLEAEAARMLKKGVPVRKREARGSAVRDGSQLYEEMMPGAQSVESLRERQRTVVEYLNMVSSVRRQSMGEGNFAYAGGEDVVLSRGKLFGPVAVDREFPRSVCVPGHCFSNALTSALAIHEDLVYAEGWAMPPGLIPVHHAWLVDKDGKVYDPTWDYRKGTVYAGVAFSSDFIAAEASRRGVDTIFDYQAKDFYIGGFPEGAILDRPGMPLSEWIARNNANLEEIRQALGVTTE